MYTERRTLNRGRDGAEGSGVYGVRERFKALLPEMLGEAIILDGRSADLIDNPNEVR